MIKWKENTAITLAVLIIGLVLGGSDLGSYWAWNVSLFTMAWCCLVDFVIYRAR